MRLVAAALVLVGCLTSALAVASARQPALSDLDGSWFVEQDGRRLTDWYADVATTNSTIRIHHVPRQPMQMHVPVWIRGTISGDVIEATTSSGKAVALRIARNRQTIAVTGSAGNYELVRAPLPRFKGTIVDAASDLPVSGVSVVLEDDGRHSGVTDQSGSFDLGPCPGGDPFDAAPMIPFALEARSKGYATTRWPFWTSGGRFGLARSEPIVGHVVDAASRSIPKATVSASASAIVGREYREYPTVTVLADDNGMFRIEGLPTGTITLSASAPGYASSEKEFWEPERSSAEIELERPRPLQAPTRTPDPRR